jgi:hypothetical protein
VTEVPSQETLAAELRVVSGSPTSAELAAITAVVHSVVEELAAAESLRASAAPSAWQRSQRALRSTLTPGAGAWRGFSG